MEIYNIMEKLVWDNLDVVLKRKAGACSCETCRADIAALALNRLKPKYVATSKGEIISKANYLENQVYLTIIVALTEAVEIVTANPRHKP